MRQATRDTALTWAGAAAAGPSLVGPADYVNNGQIYSFTLPAGCSTGCSAPYTPINYTSSPGGGPPSPSPSPTPTGSPGPSPSPSPSPSPTGTGSPGACALTASVASSWPGGYQLQLTVANHGTVLGTGWTAGFSFGTPADSIGNAWGATVSQSGAAVSASNASYDGATPAGGSATWGMIVNGASQALSGLSCRLS